MNQPSSTTSKKTNEIQYIGIDVCKARLDIHGIEGLDHVANSPEGHKKILQKLKPKLHQIALEATGGYEDRFIFQLHSKAIKVSRIEASRVRDYAKSIGRLAKNDIIDARSITEYAQHVKPAALVPPSAEQSQLKALCSVRQQLVDHCSNLTKQLQQTYHAVAVKHLEKTIKDLANQIGKIEKEIKDLLEKDEFKTKAQRLMQIKGVGLVGASGALGYMPEMGTISETQAAALVGVAPMQNQSGTKEKQRRIKGGRAKLRRIIYMNAICCIRHNSQFKALYKRLRQAGKPVKVAVVAVMRKLVILMNRLLSDPDFKLAEEK